MTSLKEKVSFAHVQGRAIAHLRNVEQRTRVVPDRV